MSACNAARRGHLVLWPRLYLARQNTPDYNHTEMCNPLSPGGRWGGLESEETEKKN